MTKLAWVRFCNGQRIRVTAEQAKMITDVDWVKVRGTYSKLPYYDPYFKVMFDEYFEDFLGGDKVLEVLAERKRRKEEKAKKIRDEKRAKQERLNTNLYANIVDWNYGPKGCWLWRNTVHTYPKFQGTTAARWVLQHIKKKVLTPETRACHRCDNPRCVRPGHIYAGTDKTNAQDCWRRRRNPSALRVWSGEWNPNMKISSEMVLEIRKIPKRELIKEAQRYAELLGCTAEHIRAIWYRKKRKRVPSSLV